MDDVSSYYPAWIHETILSGADNHPRIINRSCGFFAFRRTLLAFYHFVSFRFVFFESYFYGIISFMQQFDSSTSVIHRAYIVMVGYAQSRAANQTVGNNYLSFCTNIVCRLFAIKSLFLLTNAEKKTTLHGSKGEWELINSLSTNFIGIFS